MFLVYRFLRGWLWGLQHGLPKHELYGQPRARWNASSSWPDAGWHDDGWQTTGSPRQSLHQQDGTLSAHARHAFPCHWTRCLWCESAWSVHTCVLAYMGAIILTFFWSSLYRSNFPWLCILVSLWGILFLLCILNLPSSFFLSWISVLCTSAASSGGIWVWRRWPSNRRGQCGLCHPPGSHGGHEETQS